MDTDSSPTPPRGTKRKAAEDPSSVTAPRRIKKLDENVVNKIAAGEIIVAPVHALKEVIENSVDAGATSLEVLVKEGGLKLLQITDNGHGINVEDLPILCERFTTSKLKAFEDLKSIGTYGFRGEALASISHVSHLSVTTRTRESNCAWRTCYSSGKVVPTKPGQSAEPRAVAGRHGTQITIEDLFYDIPSRRKAFRSASEEFNKILDLVGRYAIHCSGVAFSCKKYGDSSTTISTQANASTVDCIRLIYGSNVANELIEFNSENERYGFQASGWTSNANYHVKKTILLLFINNRSVESLNMRKGLEQIYSAFLPKGTHPFVYISLNIDPLRIDVNVHPTKREVNFLNEDEIIEQICSDIRVKLGNVDNSRNFMTQTLIPGARLPLAAASPEANSKATEPRSTSKIYENNLVRTDAKLRKITSMLPPRAMETSGANQESSRRAQESNHDEMLYEYSDREPVVCRLITIKELRAEVRDNMHNELTEILAGHTFVGIVDERRRLAAIQGGVKLFLVDYGLLSAEYFYQVGLTDFGNFGTIRFSPALDLKDTLRLAAEHEKAKVPAREGGEDLDVDEVVELVSSHLIDRREMLQEYFSLEISSDGKLDSIPLLMKGYIPSLAKLPRFLLRLGPHINWASEKECFRTFLRELADFYVPEQLPTNPGLEKETGLDSEVEIRRAQVCKVVEEKLFAAFRARLVATKGLMTSGVVEVANLKGLYRVFERC